jgi:hydrogenase maturation protease
MEASKPRCLILACGNTLRSDDGVGSWLCDWAADHFASDSRVHAISRQQWTPDLAADIATAGFVLFIDCSIASAPGEIHLTEVAPASSNPGLATHHTGAPELLALAQELYSSIPRNSLLLTVGAGSTELGEAFSPDVAAALPEACRLLENTLRSFLDTN